MNTSVEEKLEEPEEYPDAVFASRDIRYAKKVNKIDPNLSNLKRNQKPNADSKQKVACWNPVSVATLPLTAATLAVTSPSTPAVAAAPSAVAAAPTAPPYRGKQSPSRPVLFRSKWSGKIIDCDSD